MHIISLINNINMKIISDIQKRIIRVIKNHKDPSITSINARDWYHSLLPLFSDIYGYEWDPSNITKQYMFDVLFDIYIDIMEDHSGSNHQLKGLFNVAFNKSIARDQNDPIERVIGELCGLIQLHSQMKVIKSIYYEKSNRFYIRH